MKRRKWTGKQKLQIVLEGMAGKARLAELCQQHEISQAQYYQWRDRLLKDGSKVFERGGADASENRLKKENSDLKRMIGELHMELKKSDEEWL